MTYRRIVKAALGVSVLACLAAQAGPAAPPPITALNGIVCVIKVGATEYDLNDGTRYAVKGGLVWTVTQTGADTVSIRSEDDEGVEVFNALYRNGVLFVGGLELQPKGMPRNAVCAFLLVTGTPGKLKFKGEYSSLEATGTENGISAGKLAGKQVVIK